jgi:hypothetical protein
MRCALTGETHTVGHRLLVLHQAKNCHADLCTSSDPLTFGSSTHFLIVVVSVHRTMVHTSTFKTYQTSSQPLVQRGHSFSTGTPAVPTPLDAHRSSTRSSYSNNWDCIYNPDSITGVKYAYKAGESFPPTCFCSVAKVRGTDIGIGSHDWISYVVPCRSC